MKPHDTRMRLISEKRYFFVLGLLFTVIFSALSYYYRTKVGLGTGSVYQYYAKYGLYLPLVLGLLTILKSYILLFLTHILFLRQTFVKFAIYLLLYGFWLTLGIQLVYYEPRYTDIAMVLIDAYGFPIMVASAFTLGGVLIVSFLKK